MGTERILSAGCHVNRPRDLRSKEVPAAFQDRAPRVESTPQGDFRVVDSEVSGALGLDASAGRKPEEFRASGLSYKDVPAEERALIAGGNAARLYHLN